MKIVSFYNEPWEKEYLAEKLKGHEIVFYDGILQDHEDVADPDMEVLSVFVKSHVGAKEMDQFPNLKFIATRSTGFDHIDLEEAKARGIVVSNVPTYGENSVAEMAFALLLALSRRVYDGYKQVVEESNFSPKGLTGFDLKDKVLGVVGTGHIGSYAIRMGNGFGMEVIAFDPYGNEELAKELGFRYVDTLDELFGQSDVITLHVPHNEHTHHMINMESIGKIKKGAVLLNTARGPVVETMALVKALEEGILAGAGLDVLEEENFMLDETALLREDMPTSESLRNVLANQYLIDHPRVIVTPHNAFNTTEALHRILDTTVENIEGFVKGEPMRVVGK
jgi:D-lactate dehydrogenase